MVVDGGSYPVGSSPEKLYWIDVEDLEYEVKTGFSYK